MLNWRNTLPAVEDAGEFAMDQLRSAANGAAKSARDVSSQIESWATDGYESVRDAAKSGPAVWGAVTIGMGALIGGIYALWRTSAWRNSRPKRGRSRAARTMAVSSRIGSSLRSIGAGMGNLVKTSAKPAKRSRKSTRPRARKSVVK